MKVLAESSIILLTINVILALRLNSHLSENESNISKNHATEASRIVAINLLKSYNDIDSNQVYSPLGITTILAILAEAAQGSTYQEFCNVLQYPTNRSYLRLSFQNLLKTYQSHVYGSEPSFQTWLYIYRNFTINDKFKQLLQDYYYVAVKDINYNDYDWEISTTVPAIESILLSTNSTLTTNSKDVIGFELLKRFKLNDNENYADVVVRHSRDDDGPNNHNNKSNVLTTTKVTFTTSSCGNDFLYKKPTKFDSTIDNKQYIKKMQIMKTEGVVGLLEKQDFLTKNAKIHKNNLEEPELYTQIHNFTNGEYINEKQVTVNTTAKNIPRLFSGKEYNLKENEAKQEEEKIFNLVREKSSKRKMAKKFNFKNPMKRSAASNDAQSVLLPLGKPAVTLDDAVTKSTRYEETHALKEHINSSQNDFSGRKSFRKDDIISALSANSITARDNNSKTKMLLFNGLYFHGTWAIPFIEEQQSEVFYMTKEDTTKFTMMHAKGKFHTANLPNLKARILCLPYKNQKYKMLVVLPNEPEGLHELIETIQSSDLQWAKENLIEQDLHVKLPKFQFEETSHSETMLKHLGLTRIFSRYEVDLSLLSTDHDVYVKDVVQFVNIRVDNSSTNQASLSALDMSRSHTEKEFELFEVNHPFIFMIVDHEYGFILVSGKVYSPELLDDVSETIEVDLSIS